MSILLYLIAIIAANVITAAFPPMQVGHLLIPCGSWLIGLTFLLRDWVQHKYGRKVAYQVIATSLFLSAITTYMLGDGYMVVLASAAAFLVSETTDTEIYTRLKMPLAYRVLWSGAVGGIVDSVVFVTIAGFPAQAIIGQAVVKVFMQGLAALVIMVAVGHRNDRNTQQSGGRI